MKIVFVSCYMGSNQTVWDEIALQDPDQLFLLGDNIYMDYGAAVFFKPDTIKNMSAKEFEDRMEDKYQKQFALENYSKLIAKMRAKNGLHVIWDDHDFAWDNSQGGRMTSPADIEKKNISRRLFNRYFYSAPPERDIYHYIDTNLARFIFLDNRTYFIDGDPLGARQMDFLRAAFNGHDHPYTIVCGGFTLRNGSENWSNYTPALRQLLDIMNTKDRGVLFLSGDIHENKFHPPGKISDMRYDIKFYELISSGAALNKFALPESWKFGVRRNWGMLELHENYFDARLFQHLNEQEYGYRVYLDNWNEPQRLPAGEGML